MLWRYDMLTKARVMVIALANQKGGVGKTTVALNLGAAYAQRGARALVIDCDPQVSATTVLGITDLLAARETQTLTLVDLLVDPRRSDVASAMWDSGWGFEFVPAEISLALREGSKGPGDEHLLRVLLREVRSAYDVIILDCPPSLGTMTVAALTAADVYVTVTKPAYMSLRGLRLLQETAETVREYYNPELEHAGVLVNLNTPKAEAATSVAELRAVFSDVIEPILPEWAIAEKAVREGTTLYDVGSTDVGRRDRRRALALAAMFEELAELLERRV